MAITATCEPSGTSSVATALPQSLTKAECNVLVSSTVQAGRHSRGVRTKPIVTWNLIFRTTYGTRCLTQVLFRPPCLKVCALKRKLEDNNMRDKWRKKRMRRLKRKRRKMRARSN
ncbi:uncharacterized protein [Pocillopora verrucosa]|uniref:uncharacterized protein n=1 Tax=Pocillopora verrucosa TaxID=203993 RepID=UPI00333E4D26